MPHDQGREQDDHDRSVRNEERLCQTEEKWVAHATVHELEAQALRLQHGEYERRLDTLNHENARISAHDTLFAPRELLDGALRELNAKLDQLSGTLGITLPREVFEAYTKEQTQREEKAATALRNEVQITTTLLDTGRERNETRIKQLEDWKNKATGAAVILTLVAGAIGAVIVKALGG